MFFSKREEVSMEILPMPVSQAHQVSANSNDLLLTSASMNNIPIQPGQ